MSRASTVVPLAACVLLAAAVLAAFAWADRRDLAFTQPIEAATVVARIEPEKRGCQSRILVEDDFDIVEVSYVKLAGPQPAAEIIVYDSYTKRILARGVRPAHPQSGPVATRVRPAVAEGVAINLCVKNLGPGRLGVAGQRAYGVATTFRHSRSRSSLSQVPTIFERATVFRPLGPWVYWVLLAVLLLGVPALLWRAVDAAR